MKAIEITDIHENDNLRLIDTERPTPQAGQVLIKVAYAGVNRPDLLQRKGMHPVPEGASPYPGLDIAGEIVSFGPAAMPADKEEPSLEVYHHDFKIGDHVCALLPGGGYAEYAVADIATCLPLPANLSLPEAAALPECVFTVWNNVFVRGKLRAEDTILIHGGSSGIGSFAIQMAKAAGARVITTAGSPEKCKACIELGADLAINYKEEDFKDTITSAYGDHSVNVVLDMVGGDYLPKNLRLMATDGRHVNIAFLNGKDSEIDISLIMKQRLTLTGSTLRTRPLSEKAEIAAALYDIVWPWIEEGLIIPRIHSTFKLEDVLKAHNLMKKSDHIGKIILEI